jgi:hypothetical protein
VSRDHARQDREANAEQRPAAARVWFAGGLPAMNYTNPPVILRAQRDFNCHLRSDSAANLTKVVEARSSNRQETRPVDWAYIQPMFGTNRYSV